MDDGAPELTGYSKCNLERCTYRFLQHMAKSLSLPSNVKKVHLVALIYAKKNLSEEEVEDIKHHVLLERQLANSSKRTAQKKKKARLQGSEVSSSYTSRLSPPMTLTPRSTTHADTRGALKVYTHSPRVDPVQPRGSDRVLRSYNVKTYKRPNYAFLNNAEHIPTTEPQARPARPPAVPGALQGLRHSLMRAAVVSIPQLSTEHQDQSAINHKATQQPNPNYQCLQSIGFRRADGRISKINALVQKSAPNISVHDIERSNFRNAAAGVTLQDLLYSNIHSQIFTNPMQDRYQRQKTVKRKLAMDFDSEPNVKKMIEGTKNTIEYILSQSKSNSAKRTASKVFSTNTNKNVNILRPTATRKNDYRTIDLAESTLNSSSDKSTTTDSNLSKRRASILSGDLANGQSNIFAHENSTLARVNTLASVATTTNHYPNFSTIYDSSFNPPNLSNTLNSQQLKTVRNVKHMSNNVRSTNNYRDMSNLTADICQNMSNLTEDDNNNISNLTAGSCKDYPTMSGPRETVTNFNQSNLTAGSENYPNLSGLAVTVANVNQNSYPNMSMTATNRKMLTLTVSSVYPSICPSLTETVTNVNHRISNSTAGSETYANMSGLRKPVTNFNQKMRNSIACSVNNYTKSNLTETIIDDHGNTSTIIENGITSTNMSSIVEVATNECQFLAITTVSVVNQCSKIKLTETVTHYYQSMNQYPNMSGLTETLTSDLPALTDILSNNYDMTLEGKPNEVSAESSVYHHKKIRAKEGPRRQSMLLVQEQLPKINEVFTKFNDYFKDPTQPLYVQVGSESERALNDALYIQHSNDTSMIEVIYNLKQRFLTNPPLVAWREPPGTILVYSTSVMCSTMVQPSTAPSDPQHNMSSCELDSQLASQGDACSQVCDLSELEDAQSQLYSQDSSVGSQDIGACVTLPEMMEDALEIVSQDGVSDGSLCMSQCWRPLRDYMERIGLEVRMQCILCSWAGPKFILELHIRKEHSSDILDQESKNSWNITHRLGALVAQPQWRSVVAQRRARLYALSVKYEDPDCFMAALATIAPDPSPKMGTITIYHKVTGEPYSWQGRVQELPVNMPYENDSHCLKLQLSRLELIPNSARLKLHNREFVLSSSYSKALLDTELVAQSPPKTVFGRPELNDIQITVFVTIDD